ncbi:unnamed protein product, partial [Staurois parvus]
TFTHVTEFIIFGFPGLQNFNNLLSCVFLCIYLFTLSGNGFIFFLVIFDRHLHTPMYFFVSNLSFIDITYTSVTIPKMLAKFLMNLDTISFTACFVQMYFFLSLGATDCYLLAVMAYDRYVAICSPLHYQTIMTRKLCIILSMAAWCVGFASPLTGTILALKLPYCGPNILYHYYCDIDPLLSLACADIFLNMAVRVFHERRCRFFNHFCNCYILHKDYFNNLQDSSKGGRKKTFSTCASHFTVVSIAFLPGLFVYLCPTNFLSAEVNSLVAMLYTVLPPMMNPIIYSMRNKDIKMAFQRKIGLIKSSLATE